MIILRNNEIFWQSNSAYLCALLVLDPAFDCYVPQIRMAGGVPISVLLELPSNPASSADYKLSLNAIEAAITPRTKMLVLNNPHNPTGKLFTRLVSFSARCSWRHIWVFLEKTTDRQKVFYIFCTWQNARLYIKLLCERQNGIIIVILASVFS